jgi:hypothetical protein
MTAMTLACDSELRWEGVSDPMKIQVRVGPSRMAGQGIFAAQDIHKARGSCSTSGRRFRAENAHGV